MDKKKTTRKPYPKNRKRPLHREKICKYCGEVYTYMKSHIKQCKKYNDIEDIEDVEDVEDVDDVTFLDDFNPELYKTPNEKISNAKENYMTIFNADEFGNPFNKDFTPPETYDNRKFKNKDFFPDNKVHCQYCGRRTTKDNLPRHQHYWCKVYSDREPKKGGKSRKNKKSKKNKTKKH